jgi:serine/threonine protein kinase
MINLDSADPFSIIGLVVAKHLIEVLLGAGGMGAVYRGKHQILTELRALKFCLVKQSDPVAFERLMLEVRIGATLNHPSIVKVFDVEEWVAPDGTKVPVIIMEFIEGQSFRKLIDQKGRLEWPDAARIVVDVLAGLAYAHSKGVIHRDIKPDNVMLTSSGVIKILDFGIANSVSRAVRLTKTGFPVGTPPYMSPEHISDSSNADGRTDVYACAAMLYYAISGRLPYSQYPQILALLQAKMREDPIPIRDLVPGLPPHVAAIIEKGLARDRNQRFQSADEMRVALEQALTGIGCFVGPDTPTLNPAYAARHSGVPVEIPHETSSGRTVSELISDRVASPQTAPLTPKAPAARKKLLAGFGIGVVLVAAVVATVALTRGSNTQKEPPPVEEIAKPVPQPEEKPVGPPEPKPEALALSRVFLDVTPPDAKVAVDGKALGGSSPHILKGKPGQTLALAVSAEGYVAKRDSVTLTGNDQRRHIALVAEAKPTTQPADPTTAVANGTLVVMVLPFAEVTIDGVPVGETPIRRTLKAGKHTVELRNDGLQKKETLAITIVPGKTNRVSRRWTE